MLIELEKVIDYEKSNTSKVSKNILPSATPDEMDVRWMEKKRGALVTSRCAPGTKWTLLLGRAG